MVYTENGHSKELHRCQGKGKEKLSWFKFHVDCLTTNEYLDKI